VQLNRRGYAVTVFDKHSDAGGLLRYGIPNFKLDKYVVTRRTNLMQQEGVEFQFDTEIDLNRLPEGFDAYVIANGTPTARDLKIEGRDLKGVYFALQILSQQNERLAGKQFTESETITAKGKRVLVIGGGDTGSDCIGTCHRQGAVSVTQIEIMPKPPVGSNPATPWPQWPVVLKTTTSHEEGCERRWCLTSNRFIGNAKGELTGVEVEEVEWLPTPEGGRPQMKLTGNKEVIECDMVLLAMGFLKPEHPQYAPNVFLAGDAKSGASLVVRAIASGREVAAEVDKYFKR
jgi:glutamate synthase (NADPH/NADH) small chain